MSDKRCTKQWKKSLKNFKGTLFVKRKAESYFSLYRANIFEKIGIRVYYRLYNKDRENFLWSVGSLESYKQWTSQGVTSEF